ncbi:MAG: tetratricopeptide repeat protein, partial [Cyanobacteria bacterium J06649_11]
MKLTSKNIILFTLALLLTITPSTFAKQPQNSISLNQTQTIQSTTTNPEQLLEQGEALYQNGNFKSAIAILQQALNIYQQEDNNLGQAAALTNLSLVYQKLGHWKEADTVINQSLELLGWDNSNQTLQSDNVNLPKSEKWKIIAQTLDIQAGLLLKQGKPILSLEKLQQTEQIWKKLGDKVQARNSLINQAQALRISGFYRRSKTILEEVYQQLKLSLNSPVKAKALRSLGNTHHQLGNLEDSQRILQRSLKVAQRLKLLPEIAATQLALGNNTRSLGNIEDAIKYYQQAAEVGSNSLTKIQAQINLISLLINNQREAEAKTLIPIIKAQLDNLPENQIGIYAGINLART